MVLVEERCMVVCDTDEGACSRERFVLLGVALAPQIIVSSANGHGVSEDTCESRTSVERLLAGVRLLASSRQFNVRLHSCYVCHRFHSLPLYHVCPALSTDIVTVTVCTSPLWYACARVMASLH